MIMKLQNQLRDMIGKTFMYRNNNVKVLRYKLDDITATLITDVKDIPFMVADADNILPMFLPVDESITIHHHTIPDTFDNPPRNLPELPNLIINKQSAALSDIILKNIKDIQDNPTKEVLAKATAINDQVKSILDIAKIEVESMKVIAYVDKYTRG